MGESSHNRVIEVLTHIRKHQEKKRNCGGQKMKETKSWKKAPSEEEKILDNERN